MKYNQQESSSSGSNILLSVDEILGLVVGDEDDHDNQESDSESPPPPVRSDSLGAVPSSHSSSFAFPPPSQRRAQSWHAMTRRNDATINIDNQRMKLVRKKNQNRDHLGANSTDVDQNDYEMSRKDSIPSKGRLSVPNHPRLLFEAKQHLPRSKTSSLYPAHPKLVESQIAPFETTRKQERKGIENSNNLPSHHNLINDPFTTAKKNNKKPTSRFQIFEDKLREEEGTFGIMLWENVYLHISIHIYFFSIPIHSSPCKRFYAKCSFCSCRDETESYIRTTNIHPNVQSIVPCFASTSLGESCHTRRREPQQEQQQEELYPDEQNYY